FLAARAADHMAADAAPPVLLARRPLEMDRGAAHPHGAPSADRHEWRTSRQPMTINPLPHRAARNIIAAQRRLITGRTMMRGYESRRRPGLRLLVRLGATALIGAWTLALARASQAQETKISKTDTQIDGLDPGVKIFLREKMAEGNTRFTNDNVVLFLHGATAPSTCDFDLSYKDYSWADWLVKRGYVVYMGDYRNYGYSSREAAMDEPAAKNQPVTRSYLALRDIEAMVNHIKRTRNVQKVTLIGWSWGAMMAGYYASLHSDNVHKLVLYAPLYNFNDHTNLGPGSALQNKRKPQEFNFALGAYRLASEAANTARW